MPKPGRPVSTILLNINQIEETVHNVTLLCSNESVRSKVLKLCVQLYSKLIQTSSSSTQTDQMFRETSCQTDKLSKDKSCQTSPKFDADTILNDISKYGLSNEDLEFLYHNIFHNLENKILALFVQIKSLENDDDNLFFEALGKEFTSTIFHSTSRSLHVL